MIACCVARVCYAAVSGLPCPFALYCTRVQSNPVDLHTGSHVQDFNAGLADC